MSQNKTEFETVEWKLTAPTGAVLHFSGDGVRVGEGHKVENVGEVEVVGDSYAIKISYEACDDNPGQSDVSVSITQDLSKGRRIQNVGWETDF